jgi:hypothetical protein
LPSDQVSITSLNLMTVGKTHFNVHSALWNWGSLSRALCRHRKVFIFFAKLCLFWLLISFMRRQTRIDSSAAAPFLNLMCFFIVCGRKEVNGLFPLPGGRTFGGI